MEIVKLEKDQNVLWGQMCLESDEAWYWHSSQWIDYCLSYGQTKYATENISFMVVDDSGPLAICPLLLEKRLGADGKERMEISTAGSGGYGIAPALRNDLTEERADKVMKNIFETIDGLAAQNQVVRTSLWYSPLAKKRQGINILMKYGFIDCSLCSQVIDLSASLAEIWSGVRKGHKYDIHRGEKHFTVHIYDKDNADKSVFDQYRLLHHKASGRMTRPIETFEMMYDWITRGWGMLCGVSQDGKYAGFSYINIYKDSAFYSSASDDPEFQTEVPISHVIQWAVMKWLKEKGYKNYEIGAQQFGPQIHDLPAPKDLSISFFKRGFGGRTVPIYRGVKYYDKKFMKQELEGNIQRLIESYPLTEERIK